MPHLPARGASCCRLCSDAPFCMKNLSYGNLALNWWCVQSYLKSLEDTTIVVVSHDRAFLDAVATEIIVFRHKRLAYHAGNFSGGISVPHPCKQAAYLNLFVSVRVLEWMCVQCMQRGCPCHALNLMSFCVAAPLEP